MKRIILALAIMTFCFLNAQNTKFGVKGGIQLSNLVGNVENETPKFGFQIGGFVEFKIAKRLFIQPEILYSTQGGKYERSSDDLVLKQELNSSYLNFPVMLKYYVIDKLSIEAGPQIGFLLDAKGKFEVRDGTEPLSYGSGSAKAVYKTENIGLNFGASYDFTKNIAAGIRYHSGMKNEIRYYPSGNFFDDPEQIRLRNNVLSISIGYKF
ncbi:porin family protein [Flavobacterium sp. UW10123]|uniref:porin family protein n=1 Tax=Flavobacterium sp. UW10123 TaxID=3230800 RepID=UPI00339731F3